jgi:hypothetical protein
VSDPIDIKALDEYLKGGSEISQRYRELGRDDVPPELDRRVLDEARAAVASGSGGRSRSWLRWSAPVALAASVVLVVTVVIESGVQENPSVVTQPVTADKVRAEPQREAEEYKLQDQVVAAERTKQEQQRQFAAEPPAAMVPDVTRASAPAAPPPPALAKAAAERSNSAALEQVRIQAQAPRDQSLATSPVAVDTTTLDSPAAQVAAEQPAFAGSVATVSARKEVQTAPAEADSSDEDLSSVAVTGNTRARRAGRTAGPRNTISNSGLASEARPAADEEAAQIDPQKWLEEIRELRRAGKVAAADLAWQDFRKAYPQFPVADDDIARKK